MPLLDLKTELKDLKFNTRAPYIVKDINNPPTYNALSKPIEARLDDVSRLAQMLTDGPGARFAANQALLQVGNPQNYQSERTSVIGRVAEAIGRSVVSIVRTGVVTLAQAGVTGTGARFTLPQPPYYYTDRQPGGAEAVTGGRIVQDRDTRTVYSSRTSVHSDIRNNTANLNYGSDNLAATRQDYRVGPKSDLRNGTAQLAVTKAGQEVQLGGKVSFVTDVDQLGGSTSDRVNLLDIAAQFDQKTDYGTIPVYFGKYEEKGKYTGVKAFRAFIGSITDNFQASWAGQQYVGRMEQFFVYTGFSRTLSFPLTVPIFSEAEQLAVYNKVNSLLSHTAPHYINNTGIPSGVITYLRIGDYLQTPGVINSISVSVKDEVPWSYGGPTSTGKRMILPQVLELQIQFTPIHDKTPQYDATTLQQRRVDKEGFRYIGNIAKDTIAPESVPLLLTTPFQRPRIASNFSTTRTTAVGEAGNAQETGFNI